MLPESVSCFQSQRRAYGLLLKIQLPIRSCPTDSWAEAFWPRPALSKAVGDVHLDLMQKRVHLDPGFEGARSCECGGFCKGLAEERVYNSKAVWVCIYMVHTRWTVNREGHAPFTQFPKFQSPSPPQQPLDLWNMRHTLRMRGPPILGTSSPQACGIPHAMAGVTRPPWAPNSLGIFNISGPKGDPNLRLDGVLLELSLDLL